MSTAASSFMLRWDVMNTSSSPLRLKALVAADLYFGGSDRGTGVFTAGPPRFVGGTNADTGSSGGFAEVVGGPPSSPPWSHYQALAWGSTDTDVWARVQNAAVTSPTFNDTVVGALVDNAAGIEWDQYLATTIPASQTRTFELAVRTAVPAALRLAATNLTTPRGVPVSIVAKAVNTDGLAYAGKTLRYAIAGVNPRTGSLRLAGDGTAVMTDPATNDGADTVAAYVDFNNDGTRQPSEPQASARVAVAAPVITPPPPVAPRCSASVAAQRPGGRKGQPLLARVTCDERASVRVVASLSAPKKKGKKPKPRLRATLGPVTATVEPGRTAELALALPRTIARTYPGRTVSAALAVTVSDADGNRATVRAKRQIKIASRGVPRAVITIDRGIDPSGVSRARGCRGRVRLAVTNKRRTLARATVQLTRKCRYRKRFEIARSKIGRARRLDLTARFLGNAALGPVTFHFPNSIKVRPG